MACLERDVFIKVVEKHALLCSKRKRVRAKSSLWKTFQLKQHTYERDALEQKALLCVPIPLGTG